MALTESELPIKGDEYWFGDYTEGRYAWELTNVKALWKLIPVKGQLSLWEWYGDSIINTVFYIMCIILATWSVYDV